LDIAYLHLLAVHELPAHHADQFGRMLIPQLLSGRMILLTADRAFQKYKVEMASFRN
jgi:PIN domain nuclease of toxin-antitoxin system